MAIIKTPIRTVFDSSGNATGLAEYQAGEAIGPDHGGTGLSSLGTAGQYLKVNTNATGLEWADLNFATQSYVDSAVNNLIDSAPGTLDTLNELAAALNDDDGFFSTIAPTARSAISVSGDLNYNSSTGVVSYTLPANVATSDDAIALSIALG